MTRKAPHRALWEITRSCDLRCDHCLVDGGSPLSNELGTAQCLDVVRQLAEMGVGSVSLTGGEPLMRSDWPVIAVEVTRRGMALRFSSNGHFLDESTLRTLVHLKTRSFSVSLDGPRAIHDAMRKRSGSLSGASPFDLAVRAIEQLAESPIAANVITTVTTRNLPFLAETHALVKELRVNGWFVQMAHATGRAAAENETGNSAVLPPKKLPELAAFLRDASADGDLPPVVHNTIGYMSRDEPTLRSSGRPGEPTYWRGCRCGVDSIGIEPDGGVKGCANQVGEPFLVGNLTEEPLQRIWNDRDRWHWLDPQPEQMTGHCAGCALARFCAAGCRALARSATGNLFDNPYCLRRLEKPGEEVRS